MIVQKNVQKQRQPDAKLYRLFPNLVKRRADQHASSGLLAGWVILRSFVRRNKHQLDLVGVEPKPFRGHLNL